MFKSAHKFKKGEFLLPLILLVPMLILNVRNSQHWGDDFAVYVGQAINLLNGQAFDKTTYQYIPGFSPLAPSAPVGFSILLMPVIKLFGVNMYAMSVYMSVFFILWMLFAFGFFRRFFGVPTALTALFVAAYPNFLLWLKLLITSDVPFALFFLWACMILSKPHKNSSTYIIAGIITGIATIIRPVGAILIPALFLFTVFELVKDTAHRQNKTSIKQTAHLLVFSAIVLLLYSIAAYWLFKPEHSYVKSAIDSVHFKNLWITARLNLPYYISSYMALFKSDGSHLKTVSAIFAAAMLSGTIAGIIFRLLFKASFFDWACVCYLAFIVFFPAGPDYRYIIPVHIFLIFYAFSAGKFFLQRFGRNHRGLLQVAFTLLTVIFFSKPILYLWEHRKDTVPGPYEEIATETFSYIKQNIPPASLIIFNKPRALALFTGNRTTMGNFDLAPQINYTELKSHGAGYYLYNWSIPDDSYAMFINTEKKNWEVVYQNWQYTLYKDTTINRP
ncbi:MAG TPA: glycosyltransferase family 39 protein [Chitinophagales bacterium]|nr:glycosyltransferase family 39 protein [Chitinophagales bacterium]